MNAARRSLLALSFFLVLTLYSLFAQNKETESDDRNVEKILHTVNNGPLMVNASAVFLKASKNVAWLPEGVVVESMEHVIRILRPDAAEKYSDFGIYYRAGDQRAEVERAGVYAHDSYQLRPVPSDQIRSVSALEDWASGTYPEQRYLSVPLPGLHPGATIRVKTRRNTIRPRPGISGIEFFQMNDPLLEKEFHVMVPSGRPLQWRLTQGDAIRNLVTRTPSKDTYTFFCDGALGVSNEPSSPPLGRVAARLVYSTWPDWNATAQPMLATIQEAAKTRKSVAAKVQELTQKLSSPREKVKRLVVFVSRNIPSVESGMNLSALHCRTADEVLEGRVANAPDKVVLFTAMMAELGLETRLVLASAKKIPIVTEVPALEQFDTLLVFLPELAIYVDPFDPLASFPESSASVDNQGLVCTPDGCRIEKLGSAIPAQQQISNRMSLALAENGSAQLSLQTQIGHGWAPAFRAQMGMGNESQLRAFFDQALQRVSGDMTGIQSRTEGVLDPEVQPRFGLRWDMPSLTVPQDHWMVCFVPPYLFSSAEIPFPLQSGERKNPFFIDVPLSVQTVIEIFVPETMIPRYYPESVSTQGAGWSFEIQPQWDAKGHRLQVTRKLKLTATVFTPEEYAKLCDTLRQNLRPDAIHLVLEKQGK